MSNAENINQEYWDQCLLETEEDMNNDLVQKQKHLLPLPSFYELDQEGNDIKLMENITNYRSKMLEEAKASQILILPCEIGHYNIFYPEMTHSTFIAPNALSKLEGYSYKTFSDAYHLYKIIDEQALATYKEFLNTSYSKERLSFVVQDLVWLLSIS